MDRKDAKRFQDWVAGQFDGVDKWEGQDLAIKGNRCTYDPTSGEIKVSLTFRLGDAKANDLAEFALFATRFGLGAEDHGRTFQFNGAGRTYTVAGVNPRASKRPIVATHGGRSYVFEAAAVVRQLRPWNIRVGEHGLDGGIYFYGGPEDEAKRRKAWEKTAAGKWAGRKGAR